MSLRLDKFISEYGNLTRKEAKEALKKGKISLNGACVKDGGIRIELMDTVCINGVKIIADTGFHYYVLNKPAGIITATKDEHEQCVLDLLPKDLRKNISPVGRLDKDTTGLLVLTDDGQLLHRLLSPRHHVNKTYIAKVQNPLGSEDIRAFSEGLDIGDEKITLPAVLEILDSRSAKVTIVEGRYHQIKRMFEARQNKVLALKRIAMGGFTLPPDLEEGTYRAMTKAEVELLNVSE